MLEPGDVVGYNVDDNGPIMTIRIDRVINGVAFSESGGFVEGSPYLLTFDAVTFDGIGLYIGTFVTPQTVH